MAVVLWPPLIGRNKKGHVQHVPFFMFSRTVASRIDFATLIDEGEPSVPSQRFVAMEPLLWRPCAVANPPNLIRDRSSLHPPWTPKPTVSPWRHISVPGHQSFVPNYLRKVKPMDFEAGQGVNRRDTVGYLEDLQRHPGVKDAVLSAAICGTGQ